MVSFEEYFDYAHNNANMPAGRIIQNWEKTQYQITELPPMLSESTLLELVQQQQQIQMQQLQNKHLQQWLQLIQRQ